MAFFCGRSPGSFWQVWPMRRDAPENQQRRMADFDRDALQVPG
jgi:hypothetical protein